jgi:hypothetical protein
MKTQNAEDQEHRMNENENTTDAKAMPPASTGSTCSRGGFTLIEAIAVLAIFVAAIALLLQATRHAIYAPRPATAAPRADEPRQVGGFDGPMVTRSYEGHWWVLYLHSLAHHPDCPCHAKKAEAE